jgi:hypothetical protein
MYWEHKSGTKRTSYQFKYTGAELSKPAQKKCEKVTADYRDVRQRLAVYLQQNPNRSPRDEEYTKLEHQVTSLDDEREFLEVLTSEFHRKPEVEYVLAIGDVVYFNLVDKSTIVAVEHANG